MLFEFFHRHAIDSTGVVYVENTSKCRSDVDCVDFTLDMNCFHPGVQEYYRHMRVITIYRTMSRPGGMGRHQAIFTIPNLKIFSARRIVTAPELSKIWTVGRLRIHQLTAKVYIGDAVDMTQRFAGTMFELDTIFPGTSGSRIIQKSACFKNWIRYRPFLPDGAVDRINFYFDLRRI